MPSRGVERQSKKAPRQKKKAADRLPLPAGLLALRELGIAYLKVELQRLTKTEGNASPVAKILKDLVDLNARQEASEARKEQARKAATPDEGGGRYTDHF